ncbi:unnamed protein product [Auanema sp. JU1783]|nr:unnamed protein product [Auanema sp. JU1783]
MGREDVTEICEKYLSRREDRDKVKEAVERCVKKGYDYEKMRDRVLDIVSDSHKAHKVISAVSNTYAQFRKRNRFEESKDDNRPAKRRDDRDRDRDRGDRDRDRRRVRYNEQDERRAQGFRVLSHDGHNRRSDNDDRNRSEVVSEDTLRTKELMYKAQQEIEERKRKMTGGPQGALPPANSTKSVPLRPEEARIFMDFAINKKNRVEELKAKLSANKTINSIVNSQQNAPVMAPLPEVTDDIIKKEEHFPKEEKDKFMAFLDPRIHARAADRKKRGFNFHEKGEFEKLANKQRAAAKLERLQAEVSQVAKSTGISSAVKLAMVTPAGKSGDSIPTVEWWDSIVLEEDNYENIPDLTNAFRFKDPISELVEHPIKLKPPNDPLVPQYLKVYLTTRERKKIRRQNRKEMLKERTEKIRLGLEKAPEAKVKISNLMRVLGSEAVQDPTKMEAHVRKQMDERLKKHQQANAERKLTDEQRAAKKTKKISEDTSISVNVCVYRIKSLLHPAKKFKVEMNAKQLQMTGLVLLHKQINLVVVEGGPKQQKFYKNLMLSRIKWEDEIIGQKKDAEKDAPGERNNCTLIWEGQVKKRNFRDFTVVTATIEKNARDLFEKHGVAQYWDMAYSTSVLLEDQSTILI